MIFSKIRKIIITVILVLLFLIYCVITQDALGVLCGILFMGLYFYIEHHQKIQKTKDEFRES